MTKAWRLSQRVELPDGTTVAAQILGEGPPVVLVHGTPAWALLWRNVAPVLAATHTVHVCDLPGYRTHRPSRPRTSP